MLIEHRSVVRGLRVAAAAEGANQRDARSLQSTTGAAAAAAAAAVVLPQRLRGCARRRAAVGLSWGPCSSAGLRLKGTRRASQQQSAAPPPGKGGVAPHQGSEDGAASRLVTRRCGVTRARAATSKVVSASRRRLRIVGAYRDDASKALRLQLLPLLAQCGAWSRTNSEEQRTGPGYHLVNAALSCRVSIAVITAKKTRVANS